MSRLEKLVFVHYNMRLKERHIRRKTKEDVIDLDYIFHEEDPLVEWTREIEPPCIEGQNNEWLPEEYQTPAVDANRENPGSSKRQRLSTIPDDDNDPEENRNLQSRSHGGSASVRGGGGSRGGRSTQDYSGDGGDDGGSTRGDNTRGYRDSSDAGGSRAGDFVGGYRDYRSGGSDPRDDYDGGASYGISSGYSGDSGVYGSYDYSGSVYNYHGDVGYGSSYPYGATHPSGDYPVPRYSDLSESHSSSQDTYNTYQSSDDQAQPSVFDNMSSLGANLPTYGSSYYTVQDDSEDQTSEPSRKSFWW